MTRLGAFLVMVSLFSPSLSSMPLLSSFVLPHPFLHSFLSDCKSRNSFPVIINASLIGFGYASELLKAEWQEIGLRRHLFHIPKTVCAERFYKPPSLLPSPSHLSSTPKTLEEVVAAYDKERDIDVLLIGAMHYTIYPVRWRVFTASLFFSFFGCFFIFEFCNHLFTFQLRSHACTSPDISKTSRIIFITCYILGTKTGPQTRSTPRWL